MTGSGEWQANRMSHSGPDRRYYVARGLGMRLFIDDNLPEQEQESQAIEAERHLNAQQQEVDRLRQQVALADEQFGADPWIDWSELIPNVGRVDCRWCHGRKPNHREGCVNVRYQALQQGGR